MESPRIQTAQSVSHLIICGPKNSGKFNTIINMIGGEVSESRAPSLIHVRRPRTNSTFQMTNEIYSNRVLKNVVEVDTLKMDYNMRIGPNYFVIDMEILGCNQKSIFIELLDYIYNSFGNSGMYSGSSNQQSNIGPKYIILKNFHTVRNEVYDILYSQLRSDEYSGHMGKYKFVIHTNTVSCIPLHIIGYFNHVHVECGNHGSVSTTQSNDGRAQPANVLGGGLGGTPDIEGLGGTVPPTQTDEMIQYMIKFNPNQDLMDIQLIRAYLYEVLTLCLSPHDVMWNIVQSICQYRPHLTTSIINLYVECFIDYSSKYRPIYHLEKFLVATITCTSES
jgi:hypothetical protein